MTPGPGRWSGRWPPAVRAAHSVILTTGTPALRSIADSDAVAAVVKKAYHGEIVDVHVTVFAMW